MKRILKLFPKFFIVTFLLVLVILVLVTRLSPDAYPELGSVFREEKKSLLMYYKKITGLPGKKLPNKF